MSEPAPAAVFLSYAREDTPAAQRIAEALRSHGVEVWFDQSELRGGDAWDQKIKKQIRECALFLPVISTHTQARHEGYFRREWKQAVERTHDMAEGVPFLAPVVIDDTPDVGAVVPAEFLRVQWTRLPGALPTPQFVEQVRRLLDAPRKAAPATSSGTAPRPAPNGSAEMAPPRAGRRIPPAAWCMLVALIVAIVAGVVLVRRSGPNIAAGTRPPTAEKSPLPAPAAPLANAKSIAVLPFANMSDEKDSAFFTDGIHEDILTNLSNIRELKVVSRTTVVQYRDSKKTLRQIGEELGVAYILEGSVRRAGNKVRVTGQLINARTDEHIWAMAYDRDLTDIFAIQSELAQAIATALQTAISPQEKSLLEQRPTDNLAAYELVLKAHELRNRIGFEYDEQERLLQRAVQLDPTYALAYADLAYLYAFAYFVNGPAAADLTKAKVAIDTAMRLAPGSPDVVRAVGDYYYYGFRDYARALEQYEKLARLRPNDPAYYARVAAIQRRQAHWAEALVSFQKLEEIEPGNLHNRRDAAILLTAGRRFGEAIEEMRRVVERAPDDLQAGFELAGLPYFATGSTREMEQFLAGLTPAQLNSEPGLAVRKEWALRRGDLAEAVRLDGLRPPDDATAVEMALALAALGKTEAVSARLGNIPAELRAQAASGHSNSYTWSNLGMVEALLGHKEDALRCARKATELMPESRDAPVGAAHRANLAMVWSWTGDKDAAIAEYARLLRTPYGSVNGGGGALPDATIAVMKRDPLYTPLRGDPRFEALLNDPKNNAPLF